MAYFDFTSFEVSFHQYVKYVLGKPVADASKKDLLNAVSYAVGKYLMDINFETQERYAKNDAKQVYYLSMEFLIGRLLSNNLLNLGIFDACARFLQKQGIDLETLVEEEQDPALGKEGWQPVFWILWPVWTCLDSDMGSTMIMDCSAR